MSKKSRAKKIDRENLTITHLVNTKDLDRYYTVALPKGADVKNYLKNNVVLWAHNHDESQSVMPIGKCIKLEKQEDYIEVVTQFNAKDDFAVKVFNAYADGMLNAWSVGFMPKKAEIYTKKNRKELNKKYELSVSEKQLTEAEAMTWFGAAIYTEWELFEYSAVPVPGNPGALTDDFKRELVDRGLMSVEETRSLDLRNNTPQMYSLASQEDIVECEFIDKTEGEGMKEASKVEITADEKTELSVEETVSEDTVVEDEANKEIVEDLVEEAIVEAVEEAVVEEAVDESDVEEAAEEDSEVEEEVAEEEVVEDAVEDIVEDVVEEAVEDIVEEAVDPLEQLSEKLLAAIANVGTSVQEQMTELANENEALRSELEEVKKGLSKDNIKNIRKISKVNKEEVKEKSSWVIKACSRQ